MIHSLKLSNIRSIEVPKLSQFSAPNSICVKVTDEFCDFKRFPWRQALISKESSNLQNEKCVFLMADGKKSASAWLQTLKNSERDIEN